MHGEERGADHIVVGLVIAFDFSIGGGVVAMCSFEDEVEFVVKHLAELSIAGEGAIFVCPDSDDFVTLAEKGVDEKTNEVKRGSFAGGREDPRI